jgi:hypothetical protein
MSSAIELFREITNQPAIAETTAVAPKKKAKDIFDEERNKSFSGKVSDVAQDVLQTIEIGGEGIPFSVAGTPAAGLEAPLRFAKRFVIDETANFFASPIFAFRVLSGQATPAEEARSRRGAAFAGSIPAGVVGAGLGAAAGAPVAPPFGSIVGAGIGAGSLAAATYQALESKEKGKRIGILTLPEDNAVGEILQQAKQTGAAAVIGGVAGGVLAALPIGARAFGAKAAGPNARNVPPGLKGARPEDLASARLRQGEQIELPINKVHAERRETYGTTADLNTTFEQAPNMRAAAEVVKEGAKREFMDLDSEAALQAHAKEIVWEGIGENRFAQRTAGRRAHEFKRTLKEDQLEDVFFSIEKTRNPFKPNDTAEKLQARMTPEMKAAQKQMQETLETTRQAVNESGYSKQLAFHRDYISHLWVGPKGSIDQMARKWLRDNPFANKRKFATAVQGMEEAGLTLRTANAADVLQFYENVNMRIVANNRMMGELQAATFADGTPIATTGKAPAGYRRIENPFGGPALKVTPEIHSIVNFALEQPFNNQWLRRIETINAFSKSARLRLSLFHHFSLTESAMSIMAGIKPKFLLPHKFVGFVRQGLHLLDDDRFMADAIKNARITTAIPGDVQAQRVHRVLQGMEARTRGIPGISRAFKAIRRADEIWNDILWTKYFNALKASTYYELLPHLQQKFPNMSSAEIKLALGEVINNVYGGQNFDRVFGRLTASPKMQQMMHLMFLAPDWTISNINVGLQPFSKNAIVRSVGRRTFLGHALFLTMTTEMQNYIFTGMKGDPHFTWDRGKDGRKNVSPGHEFDIELPFRNEQGRRMYAKVGKQVRELKRWMLDPVGSAGRKMSGPAQVLYSQLSGRSTIGSTFPSPFDEERMRSRGIKPTFANQAALRAKDAAETLFLPFSIDLSGKAFPPVTMSSSQFAFTLPMSQGTTPFRTIRNYEAAIEDMIQAAAEGDTSGVADAKERIVLFGKQALDNNIDPSGTYQTAWRNVKSRITRPQRREILEEATKERAKRLK